MSMWQFLNSDFGVLLCAFVLTTIVGTILTTRMQRGAWERETRVQLMRERYNEGTRLLESLSILIGRRFYATKRLVWALETPASYDLAAIKREYSEVVGEWNSRMWDIRNKIRLLLSERHADRFLDYDDDVREMPESVHYTFVRLGRLIQQPHADLAALGAELNLANHACSRLLESLTTDFQKRAATLELLNLTEAQEPRQR